ncbi:MAG: hypothetical protein Kow0067_02870 [Coriobacteriia bacterium]
MSPRELLLVARHRWWLLALTTGLSLALAFLPSDGTPAQYQAQVTLGRFSTANAEALSGTGVLGVAVPDSLRLQALPRLVADETLLAEAAARAGDGLTPEELDAATEVEVFVDTQTATIDARAATAEEARRYANALAETIVERMRSDYAASLEAAAANLTATAAALESRMAETATALAADPGDALLSARLDALSGALADVVRSRELLIVAAADPESWVTEIARTSSAVSVGGGGLSRGMLLAPVIGLIAGLGLAVVWQAIAGVVLDAGHAERIAGAPVLGDATTGISGPAAFAGLAADAVRAVRAGEKPVLGVLPGGLHPAGDAAERLAAALAEAGVSAAVIDAGSDVPTAADVVLVNGANPAASPSALATPLTGAFLVARRYATSAADLRRSAATLGTAGIDLHGVALTERA